ncbi:expressed unknown protein [Seminavis robusta]|uniref:Uncharacterized protein n=1 Tax=Seminavis robusta TaxID=568900 RepID=A0A9N8DSL7_9STRA|nr:expressed unknown protein [Seminavis robusta]|eukprot:Sro323_g117300.1 n/a (1154) ;mRNA; f:25882-29430
MVVEEESFGIAGFSESAGGQAEGVEDFEFGGVGTDGLDGYNDEYGESDLGAGGGYDDFDDNFDIENNTDSKLEGTAADANAASNDFSKLFDAADGTTPGTDSAAEHGLDDFDRQFGEEGGVPELGGDGTDFGDGGTGLDGGSAMEAMFSQPVVADTAPAEQSVEQEGTATLTQHGGKENHAATGDSFGVEESQKQYESPPSTVNPPELQPNRDQHGGESSSRQQLAFEGKETARPTERVEEAHEYNDDSLQPKTREQFPPQTLGGQPKSGPPGAVGGDSLQMPSKQTATAVADLSVVQKRTRVTFESPTKEQTFGYNSPDKGPSHRSNETLNDPDPLSVANPAAKDCLPVQDHVEGLSMPKPAPKMPTQMPGGENEMSRPDKAGFKSATANAAATLSHGAADKGSFLSGQEGAERAKQTTAETMPAARANEEEEELRQQGLEALQTKLNAPHREVQGAAMNDAPKNGASMVTSQVQKQNVSAIDGTTKTMDSFYARKSTPTPTAPEKDPGSHGMNGQSNPAAVSIHRDNRDNFNSRSVRDSQTTITNPDQQEHILKQTRNVPGTFLQSTAKQSLPIAPTRTTQRPEPMDTTVDPQGAKLQTPFVPVPTLQRPGPSQETFNHQGSKQNMHSSRTLRQPRPGPMDTTFDRDVATQKMSADLASRRPLPMNESPSGRNVSGSIGRAVDTQKMPAVPASQRPGTRAPMDEPRFENSANGTATAPGVPQKHNTMPRTSHIPPKQSGSKRVSLSPRKPRSFSPRSASNVSPPTQGNKVVQASWGAPPHRRPFAPAAGRTNVAQTGKADMKTTAAQAEQPRASPRAAAFSPRGPPAFQNEAERVVPGVPERTHPGGQTGQTAKLGLVAPSPTPPAHQGLRQPTARGRHEHHVGINDGGSKTPAAKRGSSVTPGPRTTRKMMPPEHLMMEHSNPLPREEDRHEPASAVGLTMNQPGKEPIFPGESMADRVVPTKTPRKHRAPQHPSMGHDDSRILPGQNPITPITPTTDQDLHTEPHVHGDSMAMETDERILPPPAKVGGINDEVVPTGPTAMQTETVGDSEIEEETFASRHTSFEMAVRGLQVKQERGAEKVLNLQTILAEVYPEHLQDQGELQRLMGHCYELADLFQEQIELYETYILSDDEETEMEDDAKSAMFVEEG